jgi:DedD protein
MESRLKERLTGAAILVALIVLVVPEMFRGPRSVGPAGATQAAQGPPVHSYTIDLTDTAAQPSPVEAAPSAPSVPPVPTARTPQTASASPEGPAALEAAPPASSKPALGPAGSSATVHGQTAAAAPAGWSVQLGLFSKGENAQRLTRTARAKGFSTRISRTEPRGLYRVYIAGLADRSAAEQMSRKLHAAGLPGAILRPR